MRVGDDIWVGSNDHRVGLLLRCTGLEHTPGPVRRIAHSRDRATT